METFAKLFERFLVFVYRCFNRIVIQGYLPLLNRTEPIVHSFRDVHGIYPITPRVLAKRTPEYRGWVEGYARNHNIPTLDPKKRDCGPLANSLFHHRPDAALRPAINVKTAYHKADQAIRQVLDPLAA
jgi:hypothetical protein